MSSSCIDRMIPSFASELSHEHKIVILKIKTSDQGERLLVISVTTEEELLGSYVGLSSHGRNLNFSHTAQFPLNNLGV